MNDDTLSGVPVTSSSATAPTNDSGAASSTTSGSMNELELQHHHRDHARRREREHEQQRAERLPADRRTGPPSSTRMPGGGGFVGEHRLHVGHHVAERAPATGRRERDHLLLILAQQLGRASPIGWNVASDAEWRRRARLRRKHRNRAELARIEAHRIRRAHAHGDRAIVEPNLAGRLRRAARRSPASATCAGVSPTRFASAWLIVMSHLRARLAHAAEVVLDAVDLRHLGLERLGVRLERVRGPRRTS